MDGDIIKQATDTDASPALGSVETASAVQRCLQFIFCRYKLLVGEVAGRAHSAAKREPPRLRVHWTRRISDPTGSGEGVSAVAAAFARAGEASTGTGQLQDTFGEL